MNKAETIQVITLLAGNYNSIADKSKLQKELMANTWYECLKDLEYTVVLQATKIAIINSPYPPTVHDIRKSAITILNPSNNISAIEAWNEAYSMICKGIYMTQEEFEKASPIVKRFFGNVKQVAELAKSSPDVINTVTKGQFLKQYDILMQREQEQKMMPPQISNFIKQLSEKMDLKQLEN